VDRWRKYNLIKEKEFFKLRSCLLITLYGSYYPKKEFKYLIKLKNFLISNGYSATKVVKDYEGDYPTLNSSELSHRCLEFSDVNFFIVVKSGKNRGIIRELAFLSDDPNLIYKQDFTVIFENQNNFSHLSKLTLDDIEKLEIQYRTFTTTTNLEKMLLAKTFFYLNKLKPKLQMMGT